MPSYMNGIYTPISQGYQTHILEMTLGKSVIETRCGQKYWNSVGFSLWKHNSVDSKILRLRKQEAFSFLRTCLWILRVFGEYNSQESF